MGTLVFSRAGTQVRLCGLMLIAPWLDLSRMKITAVALVGTAVFFIGFYKRPRDKGQERR